MLRRLRLLPFGEGPHGVRGDARGLHDQLHRCLYQFPSWSAENDYGNKWNRRPYGELLKELPGNGCFLPVLNEGEAASQVGDQCKTADYRSPDSVLELSAGCGGSLSLRTLQ